ncbi:DUF2306 domain-containing protein [Roseobacter sinensis]|uniref:DUF2306 domain-containing protein n=1 Tax=Roseobacter sinensis TaxID=2931391 RepID=A0ABT3BL47_9RHOB|nr:DUF2306 domain-containing protein [Roseobacter sp. WL0113]MCV3274286.1 DUF2306 domain-containing protein [Roseobacter sp. WL0113]
MATDRQRSIVIGVALGALILLSLPFTLWSLRAGLALPLSLDLSENRFYALGADTSNLAIFAHMVLGALLMAVAPLQVWPGLRARFAGYHRWAGRLACTAAALTGLAGLGYIAARGTIGGVWMDLGFALYGGLMVLCAGQAIHHARQRDFSVHRRWALRLLVLIFGSWLYRVHYGLWYLMTGGAASTPAFDGAFDLVQNFAFYLPYLLVLELWLRRNPRPA